MWECIHILNDDGREKEGVLRGGSWVVEEVREEMKMTAYRQGVSVKTVH